MSSRVQPNLLSYSIGLVAVALTWGIYFVVLWPKMLFWSDEGIVAGWVGVFGDWAAHFAYASVFAYRPPWLWFIGHPLYAGRKFTYPFLTDAFSGWLMASGLNEVAAFIVPSFMLSLVLLVVLYTFYFRVLGTAKRAALGLTLFLTSGGLGWWWFVKDLFTAPAATLAFFPRQYTHLPELGIEFINVITAQLIPQRALLLGLPLTLAVLMLLGRWQAQTRVRGRSFFYLGLAASVLFLVHVHSYIVLAIISAVLFAFDWRRWRRWTAFGAGAALTGLPLYIFFYQGELGSSFMQWQPGWLAPEHELNLATFWLLNWGLLLPLALFGTWRMRLHTNPLVISGFVLFALGNLFLFQPNPWDNTKIFTWSYLLLIIPVVRWLAAIFRPHVLRAGACLLLVLLLSASGLLDLWRVLYTSQHRALMWSYEELALAARLRALSRPADVVLAADNHLHWAATQTGRQMLLGYPGWMWTYGINYAPRERDIQLMFRGGPQSLPLLAAYEVRYVVIGPVELEQFSANEPWFRGRYRLVLASDNYSVYEVPR